MGGRAPWDFPSLCQAPGTDSHHLLSTLCAEGHICPLQRCWGTAPHLGLPPAHCGLAELELPDPTRGTAQLWEPVRTGGLGKPRQHLALLSTLPALLLFPHHLCSPHSPHHLHSPHFPSPHDLAFTPLPSPYPLSLPRSHPHSCHGPIAAPRPLQPPQQQSCRSSCPAAQPCPQPPCQPRCPLCSPPASFCSAPSLLSMLCCCPEIPPSSPASQEEQLSHPPVLSQDISWVKDSPGITDPQVRCVWGTHLGQAAPQGRIRAKCSRFSHISRPTPQAWMGLPTLPSGSHRRISPLAWDRTSQPHSP